MKRLIVKNDDILERKVEVNAQKTYESFTGKWIAEVDRSELQDACRVLCNGVENCSCNNMHGEQDQDDDGKEYQLVSV